MLLCFIPEVTKEEKELPPHYGYGQMHIAFEVSRGEYTRWKEQINNAGISVVHEQIWDENLESFYFYDPDKHVLEIIPEGIWD